MTPEAELRAALLQTSRRLVERGLNRGTSGNASVRCGSQILITPAVLPVSAMQEKDMVLIDPDGTVLKGGQPSSEWRFHCDILNARPDVSAVLHTHAIYSTTLACLRRDVPAVHYHVAFAGGDSIRCARYALFGEPALSAHALEALHGRKACLLASHGMIALGADLDDALSVAEETEFLCEVYWRALSAGEPHLLSAQQMHEVLEKLGHKPPAGPA
jgi:L-fuculose-phosphate aldolase